MQEFMSAKKAADQYGIKKITLLRRLLNDEKHGRKLHGSMRIGNQWAVTPAYMENWRDNRRKR